MSDATQGQDAPMANPVPASKIVKVPVPKAGKGVILEADCNKFPDQVWNEIIVQGLKVVLGRGMTKITKELYPKPEELQAAALKKAQDNLAAMYEGKIRIMGAKTDKVSGTLMTEARRLARQVVKDELKKAGYKVSHYAASEITKAANALIAADDSFVTKAKANMEALASMEIAQASALGGIVSAIPTDPKKIADAEAKKAKKALPGDILSAAKAGQVKKRPQTETAVQ